MMRTIAIAVLLGPGALVVSGCMSPEPRIDLLPQTTVRPVVASIEPPGTGGIFQNSTYRPLFEDRRARNIGDLLTIQIQERTTAKQSSNSALDRTGKVEGKIGGLPFLSSGTLGRLGISGSSSNTFEGKGETGSDHTFTGTITVTVTEVLPNGNLVVSGDKQIGVNQNVDVLRFSGVVNPATILAGNTVSSAQVADARLQSRGRGDVDRAQTTGWLARFFLSWLPI